MQLATSLWSQINGRSWPQVFQFPCRHRVISLVMLIFADCYRPRFLIIGYHRLPSTSLLASACRMVSGPGKPEKGRRETLLIWKQTVIFTCGRRTPRSMNCFKCPFLPCTDLIELPPCLPTCGDTGVASHSQCSLGCWEREAHHRNENGRRWWT